MKKKIFICAVFIFLILAVCRYCNIDRQEDGASNSEIEAEIDYGDIILYEYGAVDRVEDIESLIYTEGKSVVLYGRDLDFNEINGTLLGRDNVMGTLTHGKETNVIRYACITTCLGGNVYVSYYSLDFDFDVSEEDRNSFIDSKLVLENLYKAAHEFREGKKESYGQK